METLLGKQETRNEDYLGLDPLLCKKKGLREASFKNILNYKSKLKDQQYMEHAIDKIAMELMHFLVK